MVCHFQRAGLWANTSSFWGGVIHIHYVNWSQKLSIELPRLLQRLTSMKGAKNSCRRWSSQEIMIRMNITVMLLICKTFDSWLRCSTVVNRCWVVLQWSKILPFQVADTLPSMEMQASHACPWILVSCSPRIVKQVPIRQSLCILEIVMKYRWKVKASRIYPALLVLLCVTVQACSPYHP